MHFQKKFAGTILPAMIYGVMLFSEAAHAVDRKEWDSVISLMEKRAKKAAELAEKPNTTQNDNCYIEQLFWVRSENADYLPSIGSGKSDQDRIARLDDALMKVSKKYKSRGLKCNQHDESGAPYVELGDSAPSSTPVNTIVNTQGQRLFGKWRAVSCEYYKDNAKIPDPCAIKKEMNLEFTSDRCVLNGQEEPVEYIDSAQWVDVRGPSGKKFRFVIDNNSQDIFWLINEQSTNRIAAARFVRTAPAELPSQVVDLGMGVAPEMSVKTAGKEVVLNRLLEQFALPVNADYTANDWNDLQKIQGINWGKEGLKMNAVGFARMGDLSLSRHGKADVIFTGSRTMVLGGDVYIGEATGKIFEKDQFDTVIKNQFSTNTKIKRLRSACPDQGVLSGDAVYEITLKDKKPVYVLAMTDAGGNSPKSRTSIFSFSLKNEERWQCRR